MSRKTEQLSVGGRTIPVSNLDKLLYPGEKFTKAKVIDYYHRISKYLLPHLKNRPVTLKRFPDGVFGQAFYEKDAPAFDSEVGQDRFGATPRNRLGPTSDTFLSTIALLSFGSRTLRASRSTLFSISHRA